MTKDEYKKTAILPFFMGFYETSYYYDESDEIFDDDGDECGFDENTNFDYAKLHNDIAKEFTDDLKTEIELDFKFIELSSPRFYNFTTDKIIAEINDSDFKKMLEYAKANVEDFKEHCLEEYKSFDGFHSFMSTDAEYYLTGELETYTMQGLLDFYALQFDIDSLDMMWEIRGNYMITDYIKEEKK